MSEENNGWFQPKRLESYAAREAEIAALRRAKKAEQAIMRGEHVKHEAVIAALKGEAG